MKPYIVQCVGRVIGIKNPFKSIECFFFLVQGYVDGVVKVLLPVLAVGKEGKEDNG